MTVFGHTAHGGRCLALPTHWLSRWFQTLKQPKSNLADGYIAFIIPKVPYLMAYNKHEFIGCTTISAGHTEEKKKKKTNGIA